MTWVAVGTAAAIGAGVGAGSAAIQGKDTNEILEGALIGGATGAVTGGAGAALSSSATSTVGTELGKEIAKEAVTEVGKEAVTEVGKEAATQAVQEGIKEGATQTIAEAAPQAIQEAAVNPQGILQAGATPPPPATTPTPAGLEQVAGATPTPPAGATPPPPSAPPAGATPPSPAGIEQAGQPTIQTASGPSTSDVSQFQSDQSIVNAIQNYQGGPQPELSTAELQASGNYQAPQNWSDMPGQSEAFSPFDSTGPVDQPELLNRPDLVSQGTNPFLDGLKSVGDYASKNKFETAGALYLGANALGMFKPQGAALPEKKTFKNPNPLSADFNRNAQTTPNVYKPITYQEGGITQAYQQNNDVEGGINGDNLRQGGIANVPRYYRGELTTSRGQRGDVYGATQRFLDMYDPASRYTPPAGASDPSVGIFRDTNPSTSSKSALEAADIRRKAIENRAYVKTGANYMPPSRDMGELDFTIIGGKDKKKRSSESDSVLAARGGIMQANLGGYAAGGNPRLLRGPGDGMSDNIPAMIGNKQPARLADGEFVVPADVVSHLGNGSTEAGAKRLHEMMNQVRMDRTGKKKQAPAVKAKKYLPK